MISRSVICTYVAKHVRIDEIRLVSRNNTGKDSFYGFAFLPARLTQLYNLSIYNGIIHLDGLPNMNELVGGFLEVLFVHEHFLEKLFARALTPYIQFRYRRQAQDHSTG